MRMRKESKKTGELRAIKRKRYGKMEYYGKHMEPVTRQKPYQLEYMEKMKEKNNATDELHKSEGSEEKRSN